jgi:hypothetical protein
MITLASNGVHAYNPSTQETKAGGLQVQSHPGPHSKFLDQPELLRKPCFDKANVAIL